MDPSAQTSRSIESHLPKAWEDGSLRYSALDRHKDTIRLLLVFPGEETDPIICDLHEVNLRDAVEFIALSYQWGPPDPSESVFFKNGGKTNVGMNLYHALIHLRSRTKEQYLWVDALCINQNDVKEKSHQIRLMGSIYGNAFTIISWLGIEADKSDLAMDALESYYQFHGYRVPHAKVPSFSDEHWQAVHQFLQRGYWSRVWIIQEVAGGSDRSFIVCGKRKVSWVCLDWLRIKQEEDGTIIGAKGYGRAAVQEFNKRVLAASKFRQLTVDGGVIAKFAELLALSRNREASIPVDKIYGVLGLADQQIQDAIIPNYDTPLNEVLKTATVCALQDLRDDEKIDLLCEAGYANSNLPSWVPDWTSPSPHSGLHHLVYKASGEKGPDYEIYGDILVTTTIMAETITKFCQDVFDGTNWEVIDSMERFLIERSSSYNAESTKSYEAERNILHHWFYKILMAEIDADYNRPPDENYRIYLEMMRDQYRLPAAERFPRFELLQKTMRDSFRTLRGRRLFITDKNGIGLGPLTLQAGDQVTVIMGGSVPFILRKLEEDYRLIGPAYVYGIMDGAAVGSGADACERVRIR
jgi:Heterokaryon incompatibility protein (HET)